MFYIRWNFAHTFFLYWFLSDFSYILIKDYKNQKFQFIFIIKEDENKIDYLPISFLFFFFSIPSFVKYLCSELQIVDIKQ